MLGCRIATKAPMQPLHSDLRGALHKASSQKMGGSTRAGDLLIRWFRGSYADSGDDSPGRVAEPEAPSLQAAES